MTRDLGILEGLGASCHPIPFSMVALKTTAKVVCIVSVVCHEIRLSIRYVTKVLCIVYTVCHEIRLSIRYVTKVLCIVYTVCHTSFVYCLYDISRD